MEKRSEKGGNMIFRQRRKHVINRNKMEVKEDE